MQVAPRLTALFGELRHEPDNGVADHIGGLPQLIEVDLLGAGAARDGLGGLLRNNAEAGLDLMPFRAAVLSGIPNGYFLEQPPSAFPVVPFAARAAGTVGTTGPAAPTSDAEPTK